MSVDIGLSLFYNAAHFECEPPLHVTVILLTDVKTGIKEGQSKALDYCWLVAPNFGTPNN
jgi:hypothetical protein